MSQDDQVAAMEANIEEKTGRPVAEWVRLVQASGHEKHGQIVKFLKSEHGFTHGYANLVAHRALQSSHAEQDDDALVATQYAGARAGLRPIYDRIIEITRAFGDDLEIAPKKSYVSLRRRKQFALVQPSTRTRVDLGINLKGREPSSRLEASGSFNAMVSHRVRLEAPDEVDSDVAGWLKEAFDAAG